MKPFNSMKAFGSFKTQQGLLFIHTKHLLAFVQKQKKLLPFFFIHHVFRRE